MKKLQVVGKIITTNFEYKVIEFKNNDNYALVTYQREDAEYGNWFEDEKGKYHYFYHEPFYLRLFGSFEIQFREDLPDVYVQEQSDLDKIDQAMKSAEEINAELETDEISFMDGWQGGDRDNYDDLDGWPE